MRKLVKAMALVAIVAVGLAWTSDTRAADSTDIYIVQLRDNPVVAYGGELGFAATKPVRGQKIDVDAPAVKEYVHHLTTTHDNIVAAIGGAKVHSYKYTFNGFAARMTADQAAALEQMGDVVQIWADELMQPQTDSTPRFLGLSKMMGVWNLEHLLGEDVVIGVIDTGIWPEHPSFADTGCKEGRTCKFHYDPWVNRKFLDWEQKRAARYGPIPEGFLSSGCDFGNTGFNPLDAPFECTNKLVTARFYAGAFSTPGTTNLDGSGGDGAGLIPGEYLSARDNDGHGSHTGSTAAGNMHVPASIQGEKLGRVSGMAPRARIAAYKVCWNGTVPPAGFSNGCASSDSVAAIDQAVADGVDVINFSIGGPSTIFNGPDDVAFLFAADAGVFVATSNGNSGPGPETTGTPAGVPWITSVGATVDNKARFPGLEIDAPDTVAGVYEAREGSGPVFIKDVGPISAPLVPAVPDVGCTPLTNGAEIDGNIALIKRGAVRLQRQVQQCGGGGSSGDRGLQRRHRARPLRARGDVELREPPSPGWGSASTTGSFSPAPRESPRPWTPTSRSPRRTPSPTSLHGAPTPALRTSSSPTWPLPVCRSWPPRRPRPTMGRPPASTSRSSAAPRWPAPTWPEWALS